ncbi:rhoptry-associated protein 1, putative [Plasmodium chabaudi chabaudi]|uniref:Rhoptry-associated protein 1, putative n=1 Tax=Plasmodium chabaudi chabaudi TaxID=31271 RepID=A0A4V0K1E3_PLACU|nr:rhoptry-associated protein 1, putative [Plasmodium chabaudi chabaudi]VTZ66665.1 rhoptry-associated protein 1, putative [Plasmodium chabaudi chabaudi]|eukprot:XP_737171.2 rhoptry-associated protein 1, putative [Plasmodium chabaudi chabaudi]
MFTKIVSLFILSRLLLQDCSVAFNVRDSNVISSYSHGYNSPSIKNEELGDYNYFKKMVPKVSFLQEENDGNNDKNESDSNAQPNLPETNEPLPADATNQNQDTASNENTENKENPENKENTENKENIEKKEKKGKKGKEKPKRELKAQGDPDLLKDRDYTLIGENTINSLKHAEESNDETIEEEETEVKVDENNQPLIKYTPDYTERLKKAMHKLGYDKEFKLAELRKVQSCPNDNFLFDAYPESIEEFKKNDFRRMDAIETRFIACLRRHNLIRTNGWDTRLKFGNSVNTFGPYALQNDLGVYDLTNLPSKVDYINVVNDYVIPESEFPNLRKLNYCLLNPGKLEKLLKQKNIKSYITDTDKGSYDEFFKNALNESIRCHIEYLLYELLEQDRFRKYYKQVPVDLEKDLKKKLYLVKSGLSYRSRRHVDNIFKEIVEDIDYHEQQFRLLEKNMVKITMYYSGYSLGDSCIEYFEKDNIHEAHAYLYDHFAKPIRLFSSCIKNMTIYNNVMSHVHSRMKQLLTHTPRKPILKEIHFNVLLNKFKKPQNKDHLPYHPTVKSFALGELTREPIYGFNHAFFEYKKKQVLDIMYKIKLDVFSLVRKGKDGLELAPENNELYEQLLNKYKKELRALLQEMNYEYVKLFEMRLSAFYQKDLMTYGRLF